MCGRIFDSTQVYSPLRGLAVCAMQLAIGTGGLQRQQLQSRLSLVHLRRSKPLRLHGQRLIRIDRLSKLCRATETSAVTDNGVPATSIPTPVVKIDNLSDPFATIVSIKYGDRLGELLDTVQSLKNLGLNIRRAKINQSDSSNRHKFYITDAATSEKVIKSAQIEQIRLTILNNLFGRANNCAPHVSIVDAGRMQGHFATSHFCKRYHPESAEELAWGPKVTKPSTFDSTSPLGLGGRQHVVDTFIEVSEHPTGAFTVINLRTTDRPGLLVDVVKVLKDISVNVISAEVDTEGKEAVDTFLVTYHGEPLNISMTQLVTNCLQYFLSMASVEREESY